jgi:hypothetical protein
VGAGVCRGWADCPKAGRVARARRLVKRGRMVDFMEGEIIAAQPTVVHLGECFKGRTAGFGRVEG